MSSAPIRVLYVDDDDALVRLVQRRLGRVGFEVVHAPHAEAALGRLEQGGIDIIALDHYLPGGIGLDLIAELGQREGAPPIVYVTGSAETAIAVSALKAGAVDFVPKTVSEDFTVLLIAALEQAAQKARFEAERIAAEAAVRAARDRAEMLLREVNHRVANSLALVSSLVSLQAKAVQDQAARDALEETQARIYAVSLVHRRLYASDDVSGVSLDEYVEGLLEHLVTSVAEGDRQVKLSTELEGARVATDKAVSLGVVVTELVTNAIKYAFPDGRCGEILVRFRTVGEGQGELAVIDNGIGYAGDGAVKGTGLGSRIVKAMASGLGGSFRYERMPQGTAAILTLQL
ncbi:Two-component sensor histidine kinase, contains HisKA and HATPase domains [Devosia enhydra]|uniref:histidine kinase n=1 Tax=Devosia enhydra TaxID=665118 RepID=A0A1K2HV10_9HYPH|nr:histidine kinase dimerization/phosphoacceptor domain -containing protein [Devosia enhydra]SFZ82450.1 Two-component sensor histidine kinase, contains HisKA and HATPase domains [Devosia enhydra]